MIQSVIILKTHISLAIPPILLVVFLCVSAPGGAQDDLSDIHDIQTESAISPTRIEHSKLTTPVSVSIVTQRDIQERGYLTLHEVFRDIPGFRVSLFGTEKRVSYHGTSVRQNRRLRVSVDGVTALIGYGSYITLNRLPFTLQDISRILVTRGTNGASFGDNAFLASIDFELKDASSTGSGLEVGLGQSDRKTFSGHHAAHLDGFDVSLRANTYEIKEHKYHGDSKANNDSWEKITRGHLILEQKNSNGAPLVFQATAIDSTHNVSTTRGSLTGVQENDAFSLSLSQKRDLSAHSRLDWSLGYGYEKETLLNFACFDESIQALVDSVIPEERDSLFLRATLLSLFLQRPFEDICGRFEIGIESARTDLEIEYNFSSGNVNYALGGSASYIDAESPRYFMSDEQLSSFRIFSEASYLADSFGLNLGFMSQYSSNIDNIETAGRISASWFFSNSQTLRLQAAQSFRIPSLVESEASWSLRVDILDADIPGFDSFVDTTGRFFSPEDRPGSETIRAYELAYTLLDPVAGLSFDAKIFYESIIDPIQYTQFFFDELPFNAQNYDMSGFEFESTYTVNPKLGFRMTYSYLDSDATTQHERGLYGRHSGSMITSYRLDHRQGLSLGYYANSKIGGVAFGRTDLVYNHDFRLGQHSLLLKLVAQHYDNDSQGNLSGAVSNRLRHLENDDQVFISLAFQW